MLRVYCNAWTCLSIVTLQCTSLAKRFLPKTVGEKYFLSTQQIQKNWTAFDKKKQVHSYIKRHLKNIPKIGKYKTTWSTKYQRINTQAIMTKISQIHSQIKRHNKHLNNIIKIGKYKNWTWRNTKQTWTLLKLTNTKKTEQQFYDGAQNTWTLLITKTKHDGTQNRHERYWKTEQHFYQGYKTIMNITEKLSSTVTKEH